MNTNKITCDLCPRYCKIPEEGMGFCKARTAKDGKIKSLSYGRLLALDLDPIEKKPLNYFYPGSMILSAGSFGCNMACSFCQNHILARSGPATLRTYEMSPEDLIKIAEDQRHRGSIGIAFTYNEPLINFEYIRDSFILAKERDLKTVLVSNGQINDPYLEILLPLVDAWNIDLKAFSKKAYKTLGGDLETTINTIKRASQTSHLEVTTLVVPGISDKLEDFKREVDFLAELDPSIPLHLSRYFPSYHYEKPPTDLSLMEEMKNLAEEKLERVLLGNVF